MFYLTQYIIKTTETEMSINVDFNYQRFMECRIEYTEKRKIKRPVFLPHERCTLWGSQIEHDEKHPSNTKF